MKRKFLIIMFNTVYILLILLSILSYMSNSVFVPYIGLIIILLSVTFKYQLEYPKYISSYIVYSLFLYCSNINVGITISMFLIACYFYIRQSYISFFRPKQFDKLTHLITLYVQNNGLEEQLEELDFESIEIKDPVIAKLVVKMVIRDKIFFITKEEQIWSESKKCKYCHNIIKDNETICKQCDE